MLPESKITFQEMTDWYTNLKSVKKLASCNRVQIALNNFNQDFGSREVVSINLTDIENYQEDRTENGMASATVDMEISLVKTMITKAFYNDKIDGRPLKVFNNLKRMLKKGANARKRILTNLEYINLVLASPDHLRNPIIVAYNCGMRKGEIRKLRWRHIDWQNMFIRLPADVTKEGRAKNIPINSHVKMVLESIKPKPQVVSGGHHDFVFTYRGAPIKNAGGLRRSFVTACKKADYGSGRDKEAGFIFHDIRRTFKTNMLAAGVQKEYRDIIVGHSLSGMDARYIVPDEDVLTKAMVQYTKWSDDQIKATLENVDQTVDHDEEADKSYSNKGLLDNTLENILHVKYRKLRNQKGNFYKVFNLECPRRESNTRHMD